MEQKKSKRWLVYLILFLAFTGTNSLLRRLTDNEGWKDLNLLVNIVEGLLFIGICFLLELSVRFIYNKLKN